MTFGLCAGLLVLGLLVRGLWVCYNADSGLLGLGCSGLRVVVLWVWFDVSWVSCCCGAG